MGLPLFKAHSTPRERGCTMCVKRPVSGGSGLLPCPLKSENPQFSSINDIGVYCQPFFENFMVSPGFLHFSSFLSLSFLYNIHFCFLISSDSLAGTAGHIFSLSRTDEKTFLPICDFSTNKLYIFPLTSTNVMLKTPTTCAIINLI